MKKPALVALGLGSSLGDRMQHLRNAVHAIGDGTGCRITALSSIYESPHMGLKPEDAANYPAHLNCVVCIETELQPLELLSLIHKIENAGGRIRSEHWGPRTIDIDILLYDDLQIDTVKLQVPHPELEKRAFVIVPLAEIAGNLVLASGKTAAELVHSEAIISQKIKQAATNEFLL